MSQELSRMTLKRHEVLQELQDVIARQLMELDTAPDAASVTASSVVDYLSTYWAGQVVSFPKDVQYKLTLKELEIYDQYDGRNKDDLARRYGMTPRGMGKLLKRIAKVDDLRWGRGRVVETLIETLKKWAMRRLPAAVAALREEVIAAHRVTPLTAAQAELAMQAQHYLNRGQGFDMHWWAWECLMGALDRPISADVAVLKPQGAAQ